MAADWLDADSRPSGATVAPGPSRAGKYQGSNGKAAAKDVS